MLNDTKLFEKIEIRWFCEDELKREMPKYRPFYREVVATMIQKMPEIRKFVKKCTGKMGISATKVRKSPRLSSRKTRKMRGG